MRPSPRVPGERNPASSPLRLRTYLAPGLPMALFEGVARHLTQVLGIPTLLASDPSHSGPDPGAPDPFASGEIDLGFLCAPGYLWLAARPNPSVELVPAAFVFEDERCGDEPVYWADLVVRSDARARSLRELRGARWVFNDTCSLSGYFSVLAALRDLGAGPEFFASCAAIGSHHAALRALERGEADCAAIDSNTLLLERRRGALGGLRVLESFGPYPVQPIVVRSGLPLALRDAIAAALLGMHESEPGRTALAQSGVRRLSAISSAAYEPERALLAGLGASAAECAAVPRSGPLPARC